MNFKYKECTVLLMLCLVTICTHAQPFIQSKAKTDSTLSNFGRPGYFLIKGKIKNTNSTFFEFVMTSYLDDEMQAVPIQKDGSFERKIAICNNQDVYLLLNNDVVPLTMKENDTLTLNWDEKDFNRTFQFKGANRLRDKLLHIQFAVFKKHRQGEMKMREELSQQSSTQYTDEQKYTLINKQYNRTLFTMLSLSENGSLPLDHLLLASYFSYCELLRSNGLLPRYKLTIITDSLPKNSGDTAVVNGEKRFFPKYTVLHNYVNYISESDDWFKNIASYREFIFNYILSSSTMIGANYLYPGQNTVLKEYHLVKANIVSPLIQDWLFTKSVILGFSHYDFDSVASVYQRFYPECRTAFFKQVLSGHYEAIRFLRPGNKAPAFTLKDENGKEVSLSDFKGKVVYIDFWGVYCGPCIYEMENEAAKMYDFYKDKNLVFINICVDVKEDQWKNALKKYNIHGVNLFAEGREKHPVCQAYNVTGVPHYVLIDKNGNIANNNAGRPSDFNRSLGQNEIDKLK